MANLAELRRQAEQYVQVTADRLKCTARQMAVRVALACVALLVGATLLVTATVLALYGAAGAVAEALGGRPWAGQLIIGTAFLLCVAIAGWWGSRTFSETSRRKTIDKYERQSFDDLTRNGLRADSTRPVGR